MIRKTAIPWLLSRENMVTVFLIIAILGMGFANLRLQESANNLEHLRRVRCVQFDRPNAQAQIDLYRVLRVDVAPHLNNAHARNALIAALDRYLAETRTTINAPCADFPQARTSTAL